MKDSNRFTSRATSLALRSILSIRRAFPVALRATVERERPVR